MGPGGLPGLQNRVDGRKVVGGFDSLPPPPTHGHCDARRRAAAVRSAAGDRQRRAELGERRLGELRDERREFGGDARTHGVAALRAALRDEPGERAFAQREPRQRARQGQPFMRCASCSRPTYQPATAATEPAETADQERDRSRGVQQRYEDRRAEMVTEAAREGRDHQTDARRYRRTDRGRDLAADRVAEALGGSRARSRAARSRARPRSRRRRRFGRACARSRRASAASKSARAPVRYVSSSGSKAVQLCGHVGFEVRDTCRPGRGTRAAPGRAARRRAARRRSRRPCRRTSPSRAHVVADRRLDARDLDLAHAREARLEVGVIEATARGGALHARCRQVAASARSERGNTTKSRAVIAQSPIQRAAGRPAASIICAASATVGGGRPSASGGGAEHRVQRRRRSSWGRA